MYIINKIIKPDQFGRIIIPKSFRIRTFYEFYYDKEEKIIMLVPTEIKITKECIFCGGVTSNRFLNKFVCKKCEKLQKEDDYV